MPSSWITVWRLNQGLVVPNTHTGFTGQRGRHLTDSGVMDQLSHSLVGIGQSQTLGKDLSVEIVRVHLVGHLVDRATQPFGHRLVGTLSPFGQFAIGKKSGITTNPFS